MVLTGSEVGQGEKLSSAQKNKYFKAGEQQYLNPLRTGLLYQRNINSLLFPGLSTDPGLSDRSMLGGPALAGG